MGGCLGTGHVWIQLGLDDAGHLVAMAACCLRRIRCIHGVWEAGDVREPPMSEDQFRWAEALVLEKRYGERVNRFITERIGCLTVEGDMVGVERMKEIARRLDAMPRAGRVSL